MGMDTFRGKRLQQAGERLVMLMGKAAKFIGAVLLALFATITSAQAVDESVPPVRLWCDGEAGVCTYSTDLAAAQAQAATYNIYKAPLNPGQVTMFIVSCNGYGVCLYGIGPGPFTYGYPNVYIRTVYPVCPVPTINPTVLYNYWPSSGMCVRTVQETCPIADLSTDPHDPNGLNALSTQYDKTAAEVQLTTELEGGMNAYSLLSQKTQNAEQCFAGLIGSELSQADSGYKVTATVRTLAYQAHLLAVWNKFFELQRAIAKKPSIEQMCPALIAKVEGEMGVQLSENPKKADCALPAPGRPAHCIRSGPAKSDPKHTKDIAFDISSGAVDAFQNKYIIDTKRNMSTAANACNLTWGGTFKDYDPVHFLCCVK